jgi:hypothetical protein
MLSLFKEYLAAFFQTSGPIHAKLVVAEVPGTGRKYSIERGQGQVLSGACRNTIIEPVYKNI